MHVKTDATCRCSLADSQVEITKQYNSNPVQLTESATQLSLGLKADFSSKAVVLAGFTN